jgi:hypothetical protein
VPLVRAPRTVPQILAPAEVDQLMAALRTYRDRAMVLATAIPIATTRLYVTVVVCWRITTTAGKLTFVGGVAGSVQKKPPSTGIVRPVM